MLNLSHRSEPTYDFLTLMKSFKGSEGTHSIMPQAQHTGCDHSTAEDFLTSQDLQVGAKFFYASLTTQYHKPLWREALTVRKAVITCYYTA